MLHFHNNQQGMKGGRGKMPVVDSIMPPAQRCPHPNTCDVTIYGKELRLQVELRLPVSSPGDGSIFLDYPGDLM